MTTPTSRIVIVSGQEFSVPLATGIEEVRQYLAQTFPDVSTATVQKGTKQIDGVTYETVEFVKKAGTKGADAADILAALAVLPARDAPRWTRPDDQAALEAVRAAHITIDAALDQQLETQIARLPIHETRPMSQGVTLCSKLSSLPAVPARRLCGW